MEQRVMEDEAEYEMHKSITEPGFAYDKIILPYDIRKYCGSIKYYPKGLKKYRAHIGKKGLPRVNRCFLTFDDAFEFVKTVNLEHGWVRNVIYDCITLILTFNKQY